MLSPKEALQGFLSVHLKEQSIELDDNTLDYIYEHIQMKPKFSDKQNSRSIEVRETTAGGIEAESFKLYNITQISVYDLLGFLGKETGIFLFEESIQKVIYAFLMLLYDFHPKLTFEFRPDQAKVLLILSQYQKQAVTTSTIIAEHQTKFGKTLSEEQMEDLLDELVQLSVLKRTAVQTYVVREKIKNLVRDYI